MLFVVNNIARFARRFGIQGHVPFTLFFFMSLNKYSVNKFFNSFFFNERRDSLYMLEPGQFFCKKSAH